MITLEDWVMIKHMHKQGVPKTRIAREMGLSRETVRKAISEDEHSKGKRQSKGSILDPYKEYIRQRLEKYDLTATRILREIKEQGYPGSYTILCSGYRFARTKTIYSATEGSETKASVCQVRDTARRAGTDGLVRLWLG